MAKAKIGVKSNNNFKKILIVIIGILLIAGIVFGAIKIFSRANKTENNGPTLEEQMTGNKYEVKGKKLIVYFSHTGNTLTLASLINRKIGGDMFKIQPTELYSYDYDETLARAEKEKKENARPEFTEKIENIDEYDTIFLGYPIWLDTMPMVVYTFLDTYNLDGKLIIPFCTYGGESGMETTLKDIKNAEPNATVLEGISIKGTDVGSEVTRQQVDKWIEAMQIKLEDNN